jgi:hypothetical protein
LWLVALACVGPFALALLVYYGPWGSSWLPQLPGSRELVEPQTNIAVILLGDDAHELRRAPLWSLVYARAGRCAEQCSHDLDRLRQVHWALGGQLERVQRVYLYAGEAGPPAVEGDVLVGRLDANTLANAGLASLFSEERIANGRVYVADPLGNLVVSYPPDVEQKELLRDLERLLDSSGIG